MTNYLYKINGTKVIGEITERVGGEYVAEDREQLIYLLNKANIAVSKIRCLGRTRRSIELTLP